MHSNKLDVTMERETKVGDQITVPGLALNRREYWVVTAVQPRGNKVLATVEKVTVKA